MRLKFFLLLFTLFVSIQPAFTQASLKQADSLFFAKKYTEAYAQYEEILASDKATPSMLLKMAFIQEGLENHVNAMYHLNLYYNITANKKVLSKMRDLADEYVLEGYEYSDLEFFQNLIYKNKSLLLISLTLLLLAIGAYMFHRKRRQQSISIALAFQLMILAALFLVNNQFFVRDKGIINSDYTTLMTGPSAGAEPIEQINSGHRVTILDELDAWVVIEWNDEIAYIRKNRVTRI